MGIYIKEFAEHSEYEEYISKNPITPNVSMCDDDNKVHYVKFLRYKGLTFYAKSNGCGVSLEQYGEPEPITLSYSEDGGKTWKNYSIGTKLTINENNSVTFKGNNAKFSTSVNTTDAGSGYFSFAVTGNVTVAGNVMSLVSENMEKTDMGLYMFAHLFDSEINTLSDGPIDASELILPAERLNNYCYAYMFNGCHRLEHAPELPAVTMERDTSSTASFCYLCMFTNCTSLKAAPALPAIWLSTGCYSQMFKGCTELETVPNLPATVLQQFCYNEMFYGCSSLKIYGMEAEDHAELWQIPETGIIDPNKGTHEQTFVFYGTKGDYSESSVITFNGQMAFYTQNAPVPTNR